MEKLQRRSDGYAETLSGLLAISPVRFSGKNSEMKWFDYRRTATADITRVRWGIDDKIAIIDAPIAKYMIGKKYAENVTDDQVRDWNAKIDELMLDAPSPEPDVIQEGEGQQPPVVIEQQAETTEQPANGQTPAAATNTPPTPQNAPEGQDLANSGTPAPVGGAPATEATTQPVEGGEKATETTETVTDGADLLGGEENATDADNADADADAANDGDNEASSAKKGRSKKKDETKGLL